MDASMGTPPLKGTTPRVAFMPTTPVQLAGMRTEPPWSVPRAMSTSPAATSAALPEDEPPVE